MSHFFTIAIISADCADPEAEVQRLLAPYDENLEVDPREEECYCVRDRLSDAKRELIDKVGGQINTMREMQHELRTALGLKDNEYSEDYVEEDGKTSDDLWKARWAVRDKIENIVNAKMGEDKFADPECEECNGTGKRTTTYNPKSKWDWWSYGGRWNGCILGQYQGDQGTVDEFGMEGKGFNFGDQYRQFGDNVISVSDYCPMLEDPATRDEVRCFAVITPDGEWHEKGNMGWWGIVSNAEDADDWIDHLIMTFDKYRDGYVAVGLDLHI